VRFVIADPSLVEAAGHPLNYACALRDYAVGRGHAVTIVGSRAVSAALAKRHSIVPAFTFGYSGRDAETFSRTSAPSAGHVFRLGAKRLTSVLVPHRPTRRRMRVGFDHEVIVRQTIRDWSLLDAAAPFTADDLVVVNSVDTRTLEGLVRWLERRRPGDRPQVVPILHYEPDRNPESPGSAAHRWARTFRRITAAKLDKTLHLAVDSEQLQRAYAAVGAKTVVLPIPHTIERPASAHRRRETPPTSAAVLFIGVATKTKGFHLLPGIVRHCADLVAPGALRFEVQANIIDPEPEVVAAGEALRALPVRLSWGPLETEAFYGLFAGADILVQPHDPNHYSAQTSGVFSEARALGLVTVVPAGTWMADLVASTGGGVVVEAWTADAYADALARCLADLPRLSREADAIAADWHRHNSPAGFAAILNRRLPPSHHL
jgi:glycosyltransferase involved in cell wall biosynthesis